MIEFVENGALLLIDKPVDWTSFDAVNKLRNILHTKKIGHAGTLDPLATGLLIVCVGKMTKRIDEFQGLEKEYEGTLVLGQTTPSFDLETRPSDAVPISHLTAEMIMDAAKAFVGKIDQVPPAHSSIKINGKRAYSIARKGHEVKLQPRNVEIFNFNITEINMPEVKFAVTCSKGTYIRSLANDLGASLGVGAYLSQLRRTRIGSYHVEQADTFESIREKVQSSLQPTPHSKDPS